MARRKGLTIMVSAPNQATNTLLTSAGFQKRTREVASEMMPALKMASYRSGKRYQPKMRTLPVATTFRGTTRAGTTISGMTAQAARNASIPGVKFK